ncbi:MAG: c-type cytochrome [Candidatus Synoicihabitans palmerolidicus]|nr:c-type cytochrome [Candidatus Synoicihabitans palmerolidicus]
MLVTLPGFAIKSMDLRRLDFDAVVGPEASGGKSNIGELVDFVALGRETFTGVGCAECHSAEKGDTAVKTGPNIFGPFQVDARDREIADPEGHRFTVTANRTYLHNAIRAPQAELVVAEIPAMVPVGKPFPPVMPSYTEEVVTEQQIEAIGAYLLTLNSVVEQGPVQHWLEESGSENYDPMADRFRCSWTIRCGFNGDRCLEYPVERYMWDSHRACIIASISECWASRRFGKGDFLTWRANGATAVVTG